MTPPIEPERRTVELPVRAGISADLDRLRSDGWTIERMRLRHAEGILEVTASRPGRAGSPDRSTADGA